MYLIHFVPNITMYNPNEPGAEKHIFDISVRKYFPNQNDRNIIYLISNLSGFALSLIRLTEPMVFSEVILVFQNLKKSIKSCSRREQLSRRKSLRRNMEKDSENKNQFSQESLCSFLNSSVNIEYVYLILTGIQKFMINSIENCELNKEGDGQRRASIISKMTTSTSVMKAEKLIIKKDKDKTYIDMVGVCIDNTEDKWNVGRRLSVATGYTAVQSNWIP